MYTYRRGREGDSFVIWSKAVHCCVGSNDK